MEISEWEIEDQKFTICIVMYLPYVKRNRVPAIADNIKFKRNRI